MGDEVKVMNSDEGCELPSSEVSDVVSRANSINLRRDINAAVEAMEQASLGKPTLIPRPRQGRQDERRVRIVYVREDLIVSILNAGRAGGPGMIAVPDFPELPEGFVVERARHCWEHRAFALIVSHPSFDVVPDGAPVPDWPGLRESAMRTVRVVDPGSEK